MTWTGGKSDPITPRQPINLLEGEWTETFESRLDEKKSLSTDPTQAWTKTSDGHLRITGLGFGWLRSKAQYRDYHLVVEYRWDEHTYGPRADRARDGGILFHLDANTPDPARLWPAGLQAQLLEGASGDFIALASETTPSSFIASVSGAEPALWSPGGSSQRFPADGKSLGHLGWRDRSENWKDVRAFRGTLDLERPVGEWNRLEVICSGDTVQILLNGETVNAASEVFPTRGSIGVQSEWAEYRLRRFELFPLGALSEKWTAEQGSADMGYAITGESILPRELPLSPAESAALWEIDGPYEMQLVACEPLVNDPVDLTWDADGNLFVAEMRDYPLPPTDGPPLSRIRRLIDRDGDGIMDEAVTWADELDHVQGLLPMRGGLLATTRTALLFLQDTDGDGLCDRRDTLYVSNEPAHNQLQISSPRDDLRNHILLSNGLDGKEIYPAAEPAAKLAFARLNLRYDPYNNTLSPSTGYGQYGGTVDAFGRHFFCSNRNPAMFAVMPLVAVQRDPLAAIGVGHEDIQAPGAPVHPISLSHTTSSAHAGTHTAACGIAINTGSLIPELDGDLFVCDPTAQLITRNRLVPQGASFVAERVGKGRDFIASGDEWTRPVQIRNGPDGALYICDMYRRFIDHARFFPDDFAKSHYLRAGVDHGRIWRLVPKGEKPKPPVLEQTANALYEDLSHPDGWRRQRAQRQLVEGNIEKLDSNMVAKIVSENKPTAIVHLLGTLAGAGNLTQEFLLTHLRSDHPDVAEIAIQWADTLVHGDPSQALHPETAEAITQVVLAGADRPAFLALALFPELSIATTDLANRIAAHPDDAWLRRAVLCARGSESAKILTHLLTEPAGVALVPALTDLARYVAARGNANELASVLSSLNGPPDAIDCAVVTGISEGLRRSSLKQKSLAALIADPPEAMVGALPKLSAVLAAAQTLVFNPASPEAERLAALPLLVSLPWEERSNLVADLLHVSVPPALQSAAARLLVGGDRKAMAEFFFARWEHLPPPALRTALELLTAHPETSLALMKQMESGAISPLLMPPMSRWSLGRSTDPDIATLAHKLFGQADANRAEIIARYSDALGTRPGDPVAGQAVFTKAACITCHQRDSLGVAVGPSLNDVANKPPVALLTDILDPNRAVEERWIPLSLTTRDGSSQVGLILSEDASAIVLSLPGGTTSTIPRGDIASSASLGISLMPVGLEAAISPEEMIDLVAFLKSRPALAGAAP
jgi:putative membrane-bound dehydrogenase-like protein